MVDKQTIEELEIIIKANVTQAIQGIQEVVNTVKQDASKIKAPIQQISTDVDRTIAKTTKGINSALDTIGGKGSNLSKLRTEIKETIETINFLKTAIEELKSGNISDNTYTLVEGYVTRLKAIKENKSLEELDYKEIQKETLDILTNEERRAEMIGIINGGLKEQSTELKKQEKEYKQVQNTENWHRGLEKIWHSFKRGLLTIIGVRSAWALFRKGMSEALQTSEKLQAQVRVTSNAFGQLFLPIMEKVVAITRKAVIFIGLVVEALTGVNLLAKATTKSIQDQNKALEGTLSSIDEIENLTSQNQTYLNDIEALGQFQEEVAKMRQWLKDSGIYEWLEKVGKQIRDVLIPKLKELWNDILYPMLKWCWEHPGVFTLLFGIFLSGKLASAITKVLGVAGVNGVGGSGLFGLKAVLASIATLAYVTIRIKWDIEELNEEARSLIFGDNAKKHKEYINSKNSSLNDLGGKFNTMTTNVQAFLNNDSWEDVGKTFGAILGGAGGGLLLGPLGGIAGLIGGGKLIGDAVNKARGGTEAIEENLKRIKEEYKSLIDQAIDYKNQTDLTEDEIKYIDEYLALARKDLEKLGVPAKEIEKIMHGTSIETKSLFSIIEESLFKNGFKKFNELISNIKKQIGSDDPKSIYNELMKIKNAFSEEFKLKFGADTTVLKTELEKAIKKAFSGFGDLGSSIYSKIISKAVFQADGYVAYGPTLAVQGEYAGARTNPEITAPQNMIEESMVNAFVKIAPYLGANSQHGDIVLNINGKEFARATYDDTQNEIARRNTSTAIKVVR